MFLKSMQILLAVLMPVMLGAQPNCSVTSVGLPPLNDLGGAVWSGYQGGLYPGGDNTRPEVHTADGIALASQVQPLNQAGFPEATTGKIVLLSIGMSNTLQEFEEFEAAVDTFQGRNPRLELVNGAQNGRDINHILDPETDYWNQIDILLNARNLSRQQVQVIWFKEAEAFPRTVAPDTTFPTYAVNVKDKFKQAMNLIISRFPNARLCYLSSRIYGGYVSTTLNPEPFAYYTGWSAKWLIENQIDGDAQLAYQSDNPQSPWLSWGPYTWADGLVPRSDGLIWRCPDDFEDDGTHPSTLGAIKVARMLLQFFSTDETASSWFSANLVGVAEDGDSPGLPLATELFSNYPNPFNPETHFGFRISDFGFVNISIFDISGRLVKKAVSKNLAPGSYTAQWDGTDQSGLPVASGVYLYQMKAAGVVQTKKMVLMR